MDLDVTATNKNDLIRQIDGAKEILKTRERFNQLINSQDFKELILEGLCVKDAAEYNLAVHDPYVTDKYKNSASLLLATAAGIRTWIAAKQRMYEDAETAVKEAEKAIADGEFIEE